MSYDPSLPTARDRMRFTLGDIAEPPLRADTEYDALLLQNPEPVATVKMAESLASEYAQSPSSISLPGGISMSYTALVSNWRSIATTIRDTGIVDAASRVPMLSQQAERLDAIDGPGEYRRPYDWVPGDSGDGW